MPYPDDGYDEPTLADDLAEYAAEMHALGRLASRQRRYVEGTLRRQIANELQDLIGALPYDRDGHPTHHQLDPWAEDPNTT